MQRPSWEIHLSEQPTTKSLEGLGCMGDSHENPQDWA